MRIRGVIKHFLYGTLLGGRGWFPYVGTEVYYPKGSLIFRNACLQGFYEPDVLRVLHYLCDPNSTYFDIGANIGLLSIPLLQAHPTLRVVSAEPSESSLPFLKRTWENSAWKDRWTIETRAVSDAEGTVTFAVADAALGAFEGMKDTQRAGATRSVQVQATTLDAIWKGLGCPRVSLIKVDVEGAETLVLRGAAELLRSERPFLLIEWNRMNLRAYAFAPESLMEIASAHNYTVRSLPESHNIQTAQDLAFAQLTQESYLLSPVEKLPPGLHLH